MGGEVFTTPYVIERIPNSPANHQHPTQAKKNSWIISTNGEDPIIDQDALDELNTHQNPYGKSKFEIILCKRKNYHSKDLEDICSRFNQVRPVVSNLEVCLP